MVRSKARMEFLLGLEKVGFERDWEKAEDLWEWDLEESYELLYE